MRRRRSGFLVLAVVPSAFLWVLLGADVARAYEFEIQATSIGQGYQLVWFRPNSEEVLLNRRRFTQSLRLHIWDILSPRKDPGYPDRPKKKAPFEMYFTSSLRFDNDFGGFTQGDVTSGTETDPATKLVPELANYDKALDVLYAYVGGRDVGGLVDFQLGRQMRVDTLDWFSFDGAAVNVHTPWLFAVDAHGGALVRSDVAGLLASPTHDPDGTSSRFCSVFDETLGLWTDPYDFALPPQECKQKEQVIPTFGIGLETEGIDVEVIDPRTLRPLDEETILKSVKKTSRLVIAHEGWKRWGFGAEVAAMVAEHAIDWLDAPIVRVGARDSPMPYNDKLERLVIPSTEDIVEAIRGVVLRDRAGAVA